MEMLKLFTNAYPTTSSLPIAVMSPVLISSFQLSHPTPPEPTDSSVLLSSVRTPNDTVLRHLPMPWGHHRRLVPGLQESRVVEGGFGVVYKGRLENGQEIAVKRLSRGSLQVSEEFNIEIIQIDETQKNTRRIAGIGEDMSTYAWKLWNDGTPLEILESGLRDKCSRDMVIRCIHIALLCVHDDPVQTPSMASIVLILNSYSVTLSELE
uniref:Uncharacterized protein n=1 Tax=Cucumis melo TaxID=3656 RepID=A0A9I9EN03_CUCME